MIVLISFLSIPISMIVCGHKSVVIKVWTMTTTTSTSASSAAFSPAAEAFLHGDQLQTALHAAAKSMEQYAQVLAAGATSMMVDDSKVFVHARVFGLTTTTHALVFAVHSLPSVPPRVSAVDGDNP